MLGRAVVLLGVTHSQSILVEGRGALPAAGPVACGGLWVDSSSSSSAVICVAVLSYTSYVAHMARTYVFCSQSIVEGVGGGAGSGLAL